MVSGTFLGPLELFPSRPYEIKEAFHCQAPNSAEESSHQGTVNNITEGP